MRKNLAVVLALVVPLAICRAESNEQRTGLFDTVLVVLGNEPLDDSTPTIDMVRRVTKAVEFQQQHPKTLLLFTGGPTAGTNSEARMMATIAVSQGVTTNTICLEEEARFTQENARFSARLVEPIHPRRILIVSKSDHLDWAMANFQREEVFRTAQPLACQVPTADSIAQMKTYLSQHPDNQRVLYRLQALQDGRRGTD